MPAGSARRASARAGFPSDCRPPPTPASTPPPPPQAGGLGEAGLGRVEIPERLLRTPEVGLDSEAAIQPAHPMSLSMNAMARAIEGKGQARPDFAQAWRVERQQEAIQRSMRERRWVRIDEIT